MKQHINAKPGVLLILCRHGATAANEGEPKVRGWTDFELDDHGKLEAQLLGNRLKKYAIKKIIHSDFNRDTQTAHIIANIVVTNDIEPDYDLRTWDVGNFSGKPLSEANPVIEEIYKNPWIKPDGSDESFNDFSRRFIGALEKYMNLASIDVFRPILIVTHGKNMALAQTYIEGGNAWEARMPLPGKMAVISVNPDTTLRIDMEESEPVIEDI